MSVHPVSSQAVSAPLSSVLRCVQEGARSLPEISRRTGLNEAMVRACVDHLVRRGLLESSPISVGCPGSGCGSCVFGTRPDGGPGCLAGPRSTGPVSRAALRILRPVQP